MEQLFEYCKGRNSIRKKGYRSPLQKITQGFTLIELMLIIAVVGILSTLGAGLYQDYGNTKRVSTAAGDVANLLTVAKTRSISQVKPAACGSTELEGYRVLTCPGGCAGGVYTYKLEAFCGGAGYQYGPIYSLPENVAFGTPLQQSVLFRTLTGAAQSSADITVSSGGKSMTISTSKAGLITLSGLESTVPSAGAPTLNFQADTLSIPWGGSVTLSWSSTNADTCTASNGWAGTKAPNNSTGEVIGPLSSTTTFTLVCSGPGGTTTPQNKTVTVGSPTTPAISSFTAEDPVLPPSNTGTVLHWTTTGSITSCTASNGWTGSQDFPSGAYDTGVLAATRTYTLTCTGPLGSSSPQSVVVTVSASAPTPTPTPVPSLSLKGSTYIPSGSSVNLSWTSNNLSSCSGNSVAGDSTWAAHATSLGGSHLTPALTTTTTYTLNCIGAGGGAVNASATITVFPGTVYTAVASPTTKTPETTAGTKRTLFRTATAISLKGFGFYVENGIGNYDWKVYAPNTSTILASGTTGVLPDTNNYYYAYIPSPLAIATNTSYVYLEFTFANASSGTTRYTNDWNEMASTTIAVVNGWYRNAQGSTDGGYVVKVIY